MKTFPEAKYTTSLAKGQGMLEETLALFSIWQPGMLSQELLSISIKEGILRKATAKRTRDMIVEQFAPRYLIDDARPAKQIKILIGAGLSLNKLRQIFLIHTARANPILHDFICQVYWLKYQAGRVTIGKEEAIEFIEAAITLGRVQSRWSDSMINRVAGYLGGCLADFGLLEPGHKSERKILPLKISQITTLYLAHDLHFSGLSDNAMMDHPDWRLFGLEPIDVVGELKRVAGHHFIPQFSGELLRISWNHQTMEEALHAIAATELR